MPIYDMLCNKGHRFERNLRIEYRHDEVECPECGEAAHMIISPVRSKLDGTDPSFPGEYLKWERKRGLQ